MSQLCLLIILPIRLTSVTFIVLICKMATVREPISEVCCKDQMRSYHVYLVLQWPNQKWEIFLIKSDAQREMVHDTNHH